MEMLGAGPYPYWASVIYFMGVIVFGIGLAAEFIPLPELVEHWTGLISFLLGSLLFVMGGMAECFENEVFTTLKMNMGWWGAFLNFVGGVWFLIGAILGFWEDQSYYANFSFGVGSVIFAFGSACQIIMWKDEQFGLTFLAALNNLGGPNGRPVIAVRVDEDAPLENEEANTFSWRGALFIMMYCYAATISAYNFLTSMCDLGDHDISGTYVVERSFNALLPCIFTHTLLGLNSAVLKAPKVAPFRQLYMGCRVLALLMAVAGTAQLVETVKCARDSCARPPPHGPHPGPPLARLFTLFV